MEWASKVGGIDARLRANAENSVSAAIVYLSIVQLIAHNCKGGE